MISHGVCALLGFTPSLVGLCEQHILLAPAIPFGAGSFNHELFFWFSQCSCGISVRLDQELGFVHVGLFIFSFPGLAFELVTLEELVAY